MAGFANALGLTDRQMTELFRRWCGLTPKSFAQAVALDHAKRLLAENATMLDATYEIGLSSASRLHDLFVTHMAMPPGAWRDRGRGLSMRWGVAPSPFGRAVLVVTDYGLAGIGFVEDGDINTAFADLRDRWPEAGYVRDDAGIAPMAAQVFDPNRWTPDRPVRVVLIGTDFEVRVWETLLKIPMGGATTYGAIAAHLGRPKAARAVGAAVGKNPISFVVPCHRVVGSTGKLTGYHWGIARKRAILGWEAGVRGA
ncbi:MAG: methylated-DNA--[protein]-cysteine S-methyltransferase [Alphaproteobacteria bacterium]|nr:methylated-DNA--[protein]-cysteine S-methyltransferase [Alphaproteobacteria bacterium]